MNIARQNFIYQQITVLKNKKGEEEWVPKNHRFVSYGKHFWSGKRPFQFFFYCFTAAFFKQIILVGLRTKNYNYSCNSVCSCHQISFISQCIFPISQSAYEYPSFIHAAITPRTNQQFLAKFSSIWQRMTWSQHDSCFCAHKVLQK